MSSTIKLEFKMTATEQARYEELYTRHLRALKLQGKRDKTIDSYARAVRRVSRHFDCCPDQLTIEQLEVYFADLVDSHSWSTVKIDRNGLQFFWKYVLKIDWQGLNIIKVPKVLTLPDSYPKRSGTIDSGNASAALSGIFINHLFNGAAPE